MALQYLVGKRERVWVVGFVAGLALVALAGVLPERAQGTSLYTGLALALVCAGAGVAGLAANSPLRWQGVSPAVGIVVGLIAGVLPLTVRELWLHADLAAAPVISRAPGRALARLPGPQTPQAQSNSESESSPSTKRLKPLLLEIASLVQKARPALDSQHRVLVAVAQERSAAIDADALSTRLAYSARDLEDVESSLGRIKSRNQDVGQELDAVIGDMTPLTALNYSLRRMSGSADANANARGRVIQLATQTLVTNQWIDGVDRRVAGAQAAIRR